MIETMGTIFVATIAILFTGWIVNLMYDTESITIDETYDEPAKPQNTYNS